MKKMRGALTLAGLMAALVLTGCASLRGATPAAAAQAPHMDATRAQLLVGLEQSAVRMHTLTSNAQVTVQNETTVVPATPKENLRRIAGKEYDKKFERFQVNGQLMIVRGENGVRNMRFSGTVVGPSMNIMFLGRNDAFWISLPNIGRKDTGDTRGTVFMGTSERVAPRRTDLFSIRPQDIWDLFFTDEVLMTDVITYMETWPDYYVVSFLRPDSPERVFSKIWFSRKDLSMVVHQIFDGQGRIIAEGRFAEYKPVAIKGTEIRIMVPTKAMMLWPRDRLVMDMELANTKVNEEVAEKWFEPVVPNQYKVVSVDDIPVQKDAAPAKLVP